MTNTTDNTPTSTTASSSNTLATSTQTITSADLVPQREGIFKGATDPKTKGPAAELTENTLISVPMPNGRTMEMPIRAAIRAGLVKVTAEGDFEEVKDSPVPREAEFTPETLSADHEKDVSNLVEACAQAGQDWVQVAAQIIANPNNANAIILGLAQRISVNPDEAQGAFNRVWGAFSGQRDAALQVAGLGPEQVGDFIEWASSIKPAQLKSAALHQIARGNLNPYRTLAKEFLSIRGPSKRMPEGAVEYKTAKGQSHIKGHLGDRRFAATPSALRHAGLID